MSSAVVSTSAALGRPFVFDEHADPEEHCHPERNGKCAKRISRGVEEPALSLSKGSLPLADSRLAHVTPASRLDIRPAPEMVSSGIPDIDALTGGLPRGCLTEIYGPASSGRTTLLLAALAAATRRGEFCAVVDASDSLDPQSAVAAGVELDRLLWVRCNDDPPQSRAEKRSPISRASLAREACPELAECVEDSSQAAFDFHRTSTRPSEHRLEQVLRATDLLLESGGFGMIVLDLSDLPPQAARRIPLTTWFRFRRAVENKPTILLSIEQQPIAGSCSSLLLQLGSTNEAAARRKNAAHNLPRASRGGSHGLADWHEEAPEGRKKIRLSEKSAPPNNFELAHVQLLIGLKITAELIRSRLERKPTRSTAAFASKAAWAG